MKVPLIYLTLWSACNAAAYISRMSSTVNRLRAPSPSPFRPGVSLTQRPWTQRFVQAPSNRQPYVVYRNGPPPQRYPMKHFGPTRMFPSSSWKSTRLSSNPEIDFARAASQTSTIHTNGDSGAIHTIPAPNLSLSEKPIIVIDADAMTTANGVMTDARKSTYEVTEKYVEPSVNLPARYIGMPAGLTETTALMRHNAALQLASELGLQAVALHGHSIPQQNIQPNPFLQQFQQQQLQQQFQQQFQQPHEQLQHQSQLQQPLIPQQFSLQGGFTGQISQQDLLQAGTEGIVIPPSALYQQDPNYLQKLQTQLLQRFPSVEFIPYDTQSQVVQVPAQQNPQPGIQLQQNQQPQASQNEEVVYINNDPIAKQAASGFVPQDAKKNVVQRETQESTLVTLVPQGFVVSNITEAPIEILTAPKAQTSAPAQPQVQIQPQMRPQNVTVHILPADSQPITTTIKYIIETTTEAEKATPVYYPPTQENVVQTATNVITEAQDISDIRVAPAVVEASEKPQDTTTRVNEQVENAMTSTINPDMQNYFSVQNAARTNNNVTVTELKPILGIPFAKKADSASVAYTFVRTDEKEPKLTQNGERVFMGQLVEAKITEDHEYNKEKAATFQSRAPLRLFVPQSSTQSNTVPPSTVTPQRTPAIKARIPPRSKLTFDDRTGEPVLRIYASYVDSPTQKEAQTTKQTNIRSRNEISTTKQDNSANWKTSTIKKIDKPQSRDPNRVTNFGLKLRSRSDDYIPLFDEYEE